MKEYVISLWVARKVKLYGEPCSTQLQYNVGVGTVDGGIEEVSLISSVTQGRVLGKSVMNDDLICVSSTGSVHISGCMCDQY